MTNHYILEYDKQIPKQVIDNQRYIDEYMSKNNILTYSDIQTKVKEIPQTAELLSVWGFSKRGVSRIWTGDDGVADRGLTTWLSRHKYLINDSDGNRTRVTAVKGRCLNRLTTEPFIL